MTKRMWIGVVMTLLSSTANGHEFGVSYSKIDLGTGTIAVDLSFNISELEMGVALDTNADGYVASEEIQAASPALRAFFSRAVSVRKNDTLCPASAGPVTHDQLTDAVVSTLSFPCAAGPGAIEVRYDYVNGFLHPHRNVAEIRHGSQAKAFLFTRERPLLKLTLQGDGNDLEGAGSAATTAQFLAEGVEHILVGYDHIAFILGLVLVGGTLGSLVKVVTSFTVAHSITLALAALGIFALPASLVEPLIALTVAWVGIENLVFREFHRRWLLTFFFGLVHGFGFAAVLASLGLANRPLLPALLGFNVGVEIGQLAIVVPIFFLLRRHNQKSWHRTLVRTLSWLLVAAGSWWFFVRVFAPALPELPWM